MSAFLWGITLMGLGVIWCGFIWQKRKKRKLIRILVQNHLLNAIVCSSCLHLLILFFPAFPCRLLLRSCCWKSRWDWSVILWQITTMPVRPSAISLSAGVSSEVGLLSAAGWQRSEVVWAVPRGTPGMWQTCLTDCVQKLYIHAAVGFYRFKTAWISFFPLKLKLNFFISF